MKTIHEYAKLFPPLEGEEYRKLCNDIKENGLREPITTHDGQILDGINRARACEDVGVRPKYEELKNGNPLDFVISMNVTRRHLSESQRSLIAIELEEKFRAEPKVRSKNSKGHKQTSAEADAKSSFGRAGKALSISSNLVKDAKRLAKNHPEYIPSVRSGKITVTQALVDARGTRAHERALRNRYVEKKNRLQQESRQAAEYLDATKSYIVALKLAIDSVERFSPEAISFVTRRHDEIRSLMSDLEKSIKKL